MTVSYTHLDVYKRQEYAIAKVFNCDDRDEEPITFEAPFTQIAPIISNSGKVVTNEMQALGSSITYMRRYLWQLVLDIIEADSIDNTSGADEDTQTPPSPPKTAKKAPVTAEKRQEIKSELTSAPEDAASEEQVATLKAELKKLMELDLSLIHIYQWKIPTNRNLGECLRSF